MYLPEVTLNEAKQAIKQGEAKEKDFFFDWFCNDSSLQRKAEALLKKAQYIIDKCGLDESKIRIIMKNNCPFDGELYDSFWIENKETEKDIYIVPRLGFYNKDIYKKCEFSYSPHTEDAIYFDNWSTFKKQVKGDLAKKINEVLS